MPASGKLVRGRDSADSRPQRHDRGASLIRAVLILGLVALVLMAPALVLGAPGLDSALLTHVWTEQFGAELGRGVLYPRWLPQSYAGLGAPSFYFYPPLAFYLSGALGLVLETQYAISGAGLALLFASGLAMYLWLRGKTPCALLGACLYMAAPYHLTDFYVRASLAEFGAFVWLPLIALAIESQAKRWSGPLLALSYAGLICTHLPAALLTTAILIPPLVVRAAWREPWAALRCAAAGVAGVAISALYLLPALTLQEHTLMAQVMWADYFRPDYWSVWKLLRGDPDPVLRAMSFLAAGWGVIAIAAAMRGGRFWPLVTLWAVACSLFLAPLTALPGLDRVQFPWRALIVVEFAAITAAVLWRPRPVAVALGVAVLIQGVWPVVEGAVTGLRITIPPSRLAAMPDAVEYLPSTFRPVPGFREPGDLRSLSGPLVRGPAADVRIGKDGSVALKATADGVITIRRAAFPRWRVVDAPLLAGPLVSFEARAGETYRLVAVRTQAEVVGGWISLLGLALAALLALPRNPRPAGGFPAHGAHAHQVPVEARLRRHRRA